MNKFNDKESGHDQLFDEEESSFLEAPGNSFEKILEKKR